MTKQLVKMDLDFGKQGSLEGLFVCTDDELATLYGKWASFGEALGKHSDIQCMLDYGDFAVVLVDARTIDAIEEAIGKTVCGYNPFNYIKPHEGDQ